MKQTYLQPNPYYTPQEINIIVATCQSFNEIEQVTKCFTYLIKCGVFTPCEMMHIHMALLEHYKKLS